MKIDLKKCGYAVIVAAVAVAFAFATAGTGFAKNKKKKEAAPAPTHVTCWFTPASPVCGDKSGERVTYKNSCYAEKDGAKVVSNKACPVKMAKPAKKKKAM